MNGFNDGRNDLVEELLHIVFFGRLPEEERHIDAVNLYRFVCLYQYDENAHRSHLKTNISITKKN